MISAEFGAMVMIRVGTTGGWSLSFDAARTFAQSIMPTRIAAAA